MPFVAVNPVPASRSFLAVSTSFGAKVVPEAYHRDTWLASQTRGFLLNALARLFMLAPHLPNVYLASAPSLHSFLFFRKTIWSV